MKNIKTIWIVSGVFVVAVSMTIISLYQVDQHIFRLSHGRNVQTADMDRVFLQQVPVRGLKKTLNKTQLFSLLHGDDDNNKQSTLAQAMTVHPRNESNILLTVPFYVYEDLLWTKNATVGDLSLEDWMKIREVKHTDDYWFAKASLRHPMRTLDPKEAKLFIVPTLLNEICDQKIWVRKRLCVDSVCDLDLIRHVDEYLARSKWFQRRQGEDHVVVGSHYVADKILYPFVHLSKCNVIGFEGRRWNEPGRLTLSSTYVGDRCTPSPKTHEFAMVASIKNRGTFETRGNICSWLNDEDKYSVAACGHGDQCPALSQAKFGFHVQGDTLGSQRLVDTILSGTVPVFTHRGQHGILPQWIDWKSLSFFVDPTTPRSFFESLERFADDDDKYRSKLDCVLENMDLVDWTTIVPFDTYMYVIARNVVPDLQQQNFSPWYPALELEKAEDLFDSQSSVKCGRKHEAQRCGECGRRPSSCLGQCQWCEFGPMKTDGKLALRTDLCIPKGATCRLPDDADVK